jgi:hypothetical protein
MVVGIGGSLESTWVLKLSHLQLKQIKMCHPRVYNSICIEHVHPKNLVNQHVYIKTSCIQNFQSGLKRLQLILHGS